ncbi:Sodium-coupled neutral amino acid transporter 3 [Reticulomyxa filosa]|uniref:Sodium-coupled neutral amino acid transporter 3 n=1 Tax=Reticulomyxa filosa TaxID=46433 RepID=X6NA64_RETFI|nr:Sodium-coupled neutral amino acid transporter 3 [Reticulomyxa filosa]|eukprot:ETO22207.1 Sodium-coupled neutral amino acid transporter 3 [Reticulomyxa filosa]
MHSFPKKKKGSGRARGGEGTVFESGCCETGIAYAIGEKMRSGSLKGAIFTMIIATVGGGMLSLAYGVKQIGLIPGLVLLAFSCVLSYFTNDLLLIVADNMPEGVEITFLTISNECDVSWGPKLAVFTQLTLIVQMFGAFISYLVAFGGLLDLVWRVTVNNTEVYAYVVAGAALLIIFPLSLLPNLGALRYTSFLGISCSLYLGVLIMAEYFVLCDGHEHDLDGNSIRSCFWLQNFNLPKKAFFNYTDMWSFVKSFLLCFPLFVFAYTAQQFMLPIYTELQRKSRIRMKKVLRRSSYVVFFIYACASTFGFLTFSDGVCSNILLNDFKKSPGAITAAISISVSMILTEPIITHTWRSGLVTLLWNKKPIKMSKFKHTSFTFAFVFLGMLVALFVTDIGVVFGVLGATTYPLFGFILPGTFFYKIVPADEYPVRRKLAVIQAVLVGIISLSSLVYQIYQMIDPEGNSTKCNNMQDIKTPNFFK